MDNLWRTTPCPACDGFGIFWSLPADGDGECLECNGSGNWWIRPSGHLFQYPGGPALGMATIEIYNAGKEVEV